jgi:hypothetical protein
MSIGISSGNVANPSPEPHPENLKPFQPGESGNPAGQSKKSRGKSRLLEKFDEERFLDVGLEKAYAGEQPFWSLIRDWIYGRIPKPEESMSDLQELKAMIEEAEAEHDRTHQGSGSGTGPMPG